MICLRQWDIHGTWTGITEIQSPYPGFIKKSWLTHYVGYPPNSDNTILEYTWFVTQSCKTSRFMHQGWHEWYITNQPHIHWLYDANISQSTCRFCRGFFNESYNMFFPSRVEHQADANFSWFPMYKSSLKFL